MIRPTLFVLASSARLPMSRSAPPLAPSTRATEATNYALRKANQSSPSERSEQLQRLTHCTHHRPDLCRVHATSDLHVDHAANVEWLQSLQEQKDALLILAGDVSDSPFVRLGCDAAQQRITSHSARDGASVLIAVGSVCERETR